MRQLLEDPEADEQVILDTMEGIDFEIEEKADGYAKIIRIFALRNIRVVRMQTRFLGNTVSRLWWMQ